MKSVLMAAASLVLSLTTQAVQASPELAKAKNCMACHAVGTKLVGPSFKEIAAKYGSDADAEAKLVAKVQKGQHRSMGTDSDAGQSPGQ